MRIRIRLALRIHASLGPRSRISQLGPIIIRLRTEADPVRTSHNTTSHFGINVVVGFQTQ